MNTMQSLRAKYEALDEQIKQLKQQRTETENAMRELKAYQLGLVKGVTVVVCNGKKYIFNEVEEIREYFSSVKLKPWITGMQILKDGSIGRTSQNLFGDWEISK